MDERLVRNDEPRAARRGTRTPPAVWLGLAWVYTGLFWIAVGVTLFRSGEPLGAAAAAGRLALTLGVGVGLCALERWAWGAAACLAALYGLFGAAVAVGAPWLPAAAGAWAHVRNPALAYRAAVAWPLVAVAAALVVLGSAAVLGLLWRSQEEYDVPRGRPFGTLVRCGLAPAAATLVLDALLLLFWLGLL